MKVFSKLTLDPEIKLVKQYMKAESNRQDFLLAIDILEGLNNELLGNSFHLRRDEVDKTENRFIRLQLQCMYYTFITIYFKTFTPSNFRTTITVDEAKNIINNSELQSYHDQIAHLRHNFISHGSASEAETFNIYSVIYKLQDKNESEYRVSIEPMGRRIYVPRLEEIENYKILSKLFLDYFTLRADKALIKLRTTISPIHLELFKLRFKEFKWEGRLQTAFGQLVPDEEHILNRLNIYKNLTYANK